MRVLMTIAAAMLVSACGAEPDTGSAPDVEDAVAAVALLPLTLEQVESANLSGELACAFTAEETTAPLLIARGNVRDPHGRVQALGSTPTTPVLLKAREEGGFDAMLNGVEFAADGHSHTISLIPGAMPQGAAGNAESPPVPARLTVTMPDGSSIIVAGNWTCGP